MDVKSEFFERKLRNPKGIKEGATCGTRCLSAHARKIALRDAGLDDQVESSRHAPAMVEAARDRSPAVAAMAQTTLQNPDILSTRRRIRSLLSR